MFRYVYKFKLIQIPYWFLPEADKQIQKLHGKKVGEILNTTSDYRLTVKL